MAGQSDLLEVVRTLGASGCLTHLLNGGHEQGDENRDDGDHDEQFDEGKTGSATHGNPPFDEQ